MGFRDLHAFNLALLAKQGWKIQKKKTLNSFFYNVFRGKYFRNGDFLYANLGHNERCISMWHDKWIPIQI